MPSIDAIWLLILAFHWIYQVASIAMIPIQIVPQAGNCGDVTTLICQTPQNLTDVCGNSNLPINWDKNEGVALMRNGRHTQLDARFIQECNDANISLLIKNTSISDANKYRCVIGFNSSVYSELRVECKASAEYVNASVNRQNKLNVILDRLYPGEPHINVTILQATPTMINGSMNCIPSVQFHNYTRCEWESKNSLPNGYYNVSLIVTTLTSSDPIMKQIQVGEQKIKIYLNPNSTTYRVEENTIIPNIECTAECTPDCAVTWKIKGQESVLNDTGILSLGAVTRANTGTYRCTAKNGLHNESVEITVEILYGPEAMLLSQNETTYFVNEGDDFQTITCIATCYPPCTYMWRKPNGNGSISQDGNLKLGKVQKHMEGRYTCTALNKDRKDFVALDMTIQVVLRYGPVSIDLSPNDKAYFVTEDDVLLPIKCSAICVPNCTYVWTKDNVKLNLSQDGTLELGTVQQQEAGQYVCTAYNVAANYNSSFFKTVDVKIVVTGSGQDKIDMSVIWNATIAVGAVVLCLLIVICGVKRVKKTKGDKPEVIMNENTRQKQSHYCRRADGLCTTLEVVDMFEDARYTGCESCNEYLTPAVDPNRIYEEIR